MKSKQNNIWAKLSSSQKLNLIGACLMIVSLFLNWFSDTDIFRSGSTYSGISGPLYFIGFTLMLVAIANILTTLAMAMRWAVVKNIGESSMGKLQMMAGFGSMYLLLVVNSVYFSPHFGLNILNKRSEIGVMLALVSTVMICIGGYLAYRRKFEGMKEVDELVEMPAATVVQAATTSVAEKAPQRAHTPVSTREVAPAMASAKTPQPVQATVSEDEAAQDFDFSERDPRGKTDYERTKLYENLRKTMLRDTMSPQQRKKERTKDTQINAFSANFGKGQKGAKAITAKVNPGANADDLVKTGEDSSAKKPQMYRMDL